MGSPRILLFLIASLIFALGLIMIFSTTSAEIIDLELDKNTHQALVKQVFYALGGFALAYTIVKTGYRNVILYSGPLLAIFTFLLVLTLIPGIGREVNGSRRWLNLAGFSFQPSEFVKYLVPAYFINRFLTFDRDFFSFRDFIKLVGIVSVPMVLIMVEPNNGGHRHDACCFIFCRTHPLQILGMAAVSIRSCCWDFRLSAQLCFGTT